MSHKILPHGPPKAIAENVWRVKGSLWLPLPRYMTIVRLGNGNLLLYSVVAMDEPGMKALEELGTPTHMIVPHPWHIMDAAFYKERYPDIVVIGASDVKDVLKDRVPIDGTPEDLLPPLGVNHHVARGSYFQEIVLDVDTKDGRALFFTDLFLNAPNPSFLESLIGPPGGIGTPRLVKFRQVSDKPALKAFFEELADLPNVQMVAGSHGPPITSDCSEALRHAGAML